MWFRRFQTSTKLRTVPHYDFVLEQGDALFLPRDITHGTLDLCRETVGAVLTGGRSLMKWGNRKTRHERINMVNLLQTEAFDVSPGFDHTDVFSSIPYQPA
eukprot:gnl/TRDRNA2_/TRDRNA2_57699_c0_seq2.p1 gnl/TRDRNA2_/TRDRNA2_57699_c0~~gnl/TRDRNA2_/TRDRNA2_57699_c0_seq2.p1  ORF type:complete len:101 (+),score=4.60 gnl/TRDRNA2_/TRDRNA2_57699_c0_seq2:56-358(+)